MSGIEPPTTAKVLVNTSKGPIEIELWAKETPLACRNFIQLCLDGYYDGCTFHRIVKDFIVQTGDPSGTGFGGSSIYEDGSFADEFHSRLKFNRRGIVACANQGKKDTNGSQFIITLAPAPELNNRNTIFGRIVGDTIFNVLKIAEADVEDERPLYPITITSTEVLLQYFDDIKVQQRKRDIVSSAPSIPKKKKQKIKVSYDEDDEEGERDLPKQKFRIRPAHELLASEFKEQDEKRKKQKTQEESREETEQREELEHEKEPRRESLAPKLNTEASVLKQEINELKSSIHNNSNRPSIGNINKEFEELKASLKQSRKGPDSSKVDSHSSLVEEERKRYISANPRTKSKVHREQQTMALLDGFMSKLSASRFDSSKSSSNTQGTTPAEATLDSDQELPSDYEEEADELNNQLLSHKFIYDESRELRENEDTLTTIDSRQEREDIRRKVDQRYKESNPDKQVNSLKEQVERDIKRKREMKRKLARR